MERKVSNIVTKVSSSGEGHTRRSNVGSEGTWGGSG